MEYEFRTIAQLQSDLRSGTVSCTQLVQQSLEEIRQKQKLNAFLEVFEQSALEQAKRVEEKLRAGPAGKLAGVLVGLKDTICYKGHRVSASSRILENFESLYSATVV